MLANKIVEIARSQIGVEEVGSTNCGPQVDTYKAATHLPPHESWPWCAAFVCWVVRQAMGRDAFTFKRPTTAGAWDMENWSRAQDDSTNTKKPAGADIQPGDIVIFNFSHIGIATSEPYGGKVSTVEGNTDAEGSREGGGVFAKVRKLSQIRSRIRFTV